MAWLATPQDGNNIPMGCVGVPGIQTPAVLQGGKTLTDANSNITAPARVEEAGCSKATYTYAVSATAPYASPTDWIAIRGSATKLVKIVRFEFSGVATAAINIVFTLKKHTVANTAGTSTNPTPMLHDSGDAAASALVLLYSAAPTIDATATILTTARVLLGVTPVAGTQQPDRYALEFGVGPYAPLVLRGVAQEFAINFAGVAVPSGGIYDTRIVFTEE